MTYFVSSGVVNQSDTTRVMVCRGSAADKMRQLKARRSEGVMDDKSGVSTEKDNVAGKGKSETERLK